MVASATALFIALFGVIGIQLASGHDPALSSESSTTGTFGTKKGSPTMSLPFLSISTTRRSLLGLLLKCPCQ